MNTDQLRKYIIRPVLKRIGAYSRDAEELLLLTAAQESSMGKYLHQLGDGPACGIYEMEPRSHGDIRNWLKAQRPGISVLIDDYYLPGAFDEPAEQMCGNLYYATAIARGFYLRFPEALPDYRDVVGMARYWKKYWNTEQGAGTAEQAVHNYHQYI